MENNVKTGAWAKANPKQAPFRTLYTTHKGIQAKIPDPDPINEGNP